MKYMIIADTMTSRIGLEKKLYGTGVYIDDITCIGVIGVIEHIRIHTSENSSNMTSKQTNKQKTINWLRTSC